MEGSSGKDHLDAATLEKREPNISSDGGEHLQTSKEKRLSDYAERKKKWYLDVRNTPCARESLINGILGGIVTGLLYYLKSSVVLRSCDVAVGGLCIISYGSWRWCRYQMMKTHKAMQETVTVLNKTNDTMESKSGDFSPPLSDEKRT